MVQDVWQKKKLKYLFEVKNGGTPKSSEPTYWDPQDVVWITPEDLSKGNSVIKNSIRKISYEGLKNSSANLVQAGSIVLSTRAPIGNIKISDIEFTTNQGCKSLEKNSKTDIRFFYYYLSISKEYLNQLGRGTTFLELSNEALRNIELQVPPLIEQQSISNFLDIKTSQIDALIAEKERLIELLEEKRQSVITETVTKGLDPKVKMKDSGIEWIGKVPEHWSLTKIKYTTYVKGRIGWQGLRSDEFKEEGNFHLVTGTDFDNGYVNWNGCNRISEARYLEAPEIHLKNDDILITKDGTIGKIAIVYNKPEFATLNSGVFVTRPLKDNEYYNKYMYWLLNSDVFKDFVDMKTGGTTIKHLYQDTLINYQYPLPPYNEQKTISEKIDKYVSEADILINLISEQITKLKEYRESLIYEAVTGKIDVRDYEPIKEESK